MSGIEQYKTLLRQHDWSYDYSDHYGTWVKGKEQRAVISALARSIDPDYAIWNSIAPEGYKIKQVA